MNNNDIHIRLIGLDLNGQDKPTRLHIAIEQGGTLTDLKGKGLWSGFVSVESFMETIRDSTLLEGI